MHKLLNLRSKIWAFSFAFVLLFSAQLWAQEKVLTGTILDESSAPLPGVNVKIKGTTVGTVTDFNGKFKLNVPADAETLVFSFVGYETLEQAIGSKTTFDINLDIDQEQLEEVVVVGYGVKKKSLVTGAIASVDSDEMISSVVSPQQALQGKAAGVSVTPQSGSPGNGLKIRIRGASSNGNSDPLYIVDGMKTGDISFLSPQDIESMEVLKDAASSAIYGTEGANGVVMITTKSGKKGTSKIDYSFQYGIQSIGNTPSMMNATQYNEFMTDRDPSFTVNELAPGSSAQGTNWVDEVAQQAPMVNHNLAFSGGSDKGTYLLSAGYTSQDGIIGGDKASYERITGRLNLRRDVKEWLDIQANVAFTNSSRRSVAEDDAYQGVLNSALMMDPNISPTYAPNQLPSYMQDAVNAGQLLLTDSKGHYYGISSRFGVDGDTYNPFIRLENERGIYTENKVVSTGQINLKPIKGLTISSRIGVDLGYGSYNSFNPSFWVHDQALSNAPTVSINETAWNTWLWENFATYTKEINKHSFTLLAGMSAQENNWRGTYTRAGNMVQEIDEFRYPDFVTSRENDRVTGSASKRTMTSYFGRLSYNYDNRYMLEATLRRDGSSLFGPAYRQANFPSISLGWNVSNESFWQVKAIDYLKVRASWGQNGSISNLGEGQFNSYITTANIAYPDAQGTPLPGAEPELLANENLRWERSEQTDIGIDLRAFDSKLYFTFDYYKKLTKDLLTPATPPPSLGNNAPFANAGVVSNEGFEFILGYRNKEKAFTYDVSFNASINNNEVISVSDEFTEIAGAGLPTLNTLTYFEEGQPIWYYRGYKTDGIFRDQQHVSQWIEENGITDDASGFSPGDVIVKDVNGDGTINEEDLTNIGSPHPTFIYGANINLGYKGFDLNIFLQGATGNQNFIGFIRADRYTNNRLQSITQDRWRQDGDVATYPRASYDSDRYYKSDLLVQDATYLKIRQIQLGYTLPSNIAKKAFLANARVYVSLNDFFTFTNYDGLDPEVGSGGNNSQGIDYGTYPISRKVLFGISTSF